MENLDDVLPYLNLRDGEEILFVKHFDGGFPIKCLKKYHEPEKFPEHLIKIKKDYYEFDQFDIITNFRMIKFGINYNYMEEDNITPLSEIFHHENLFVWVNLEDIIDYEVNFKIDKSGHMGFKFFGKGRLKVKERPLNFTGYNYEEYCQVKDIMVKNLKFELQEIDKKEDKNIQKIIKRNKKIDTVISLGLFIFAYFVMPFFSPKNISDPKTKFFRYSIIGMYAVYILFFLVFNFITQVSLLKKYEKKSFFTLIKLNYAWYQGPVYSGVFLIYGVGVALSISVGFWTIIAILAEVYESNSRKKKKKVKLATDQEV